MKHTDLIGLALDEPAGQVFAAEAIIESIWGGYAFEGQNTSTLADVSQATS